MKLAVFWIFVRLFTCVTAKRPCQDSELTTVMTECNSITNEKYRFTVPTTQECEAPSASFGIACDKVCDPGEYLDLEGDHDCHKCPKGTYSQGSGAKINHWPENDTEIYLPLGFALDRTYISYSNNECSGSTWTPRGDFIVSNADHCFIRLMYIADLKVAGYVKFRYRYTDPAVHFHFYVVDENCHEPRESSIYPELTGNNEWATIRANLTPGVNKLYWRTYTVTYGVNATTEANRKVKPVLLKSVYVNGVAYSTRCKKCSPGTYQAEEGSHECKKCDVDTYSPVEGSTQCTSCLSASQYAMYGADKCETRPMCTEADYYKFHGPCIDGKTIETYEWIEPKVCRGDLQGSVQLPSSEDYQECPLCNPGTYKSTPSANCTFCPEGEWSNGTAPCAKCPAKHKAVPAYIFDFWDGIPPNTEMYCYSVSDMGCAKNSIGWTFSNDVVLTSVGNGDDTIAMMEIFVGGFLLTQRQVWGQVVPVGTVEFVFEMDCSDSPKCTLFFGQDDGEHFVTVNMWEGSHGRTVYKHDVVSNVEQSFLWAFQKTDHPEMEEPNHNYPKTQLKIHSIKIKGTVDGGASQCEPCNTAQKHAVDFSDTRVCEPCPMGQFYAPPPSKCMKCPQDFIVNPLGHSDDKYCLKCGPGLKSPKGVTCRSQCEFELPDGRKLDLKKLNNGTVLLKSKPVFTDSGFESLKLYNFSLCGNLSSGRGLASCSANVSRVSHDDGNESTNTTMGPYALAEFESKSRKYGFVCRSDLFPPRGELMDTITEYPSVLGEELIAVTMNRSYMNWSVRTTDVNTETFDINFYYVAFQPTYACPAGRSVILTLRCDPYAAEDIDGQIRVNASDPEGTDDGCDYNFLRISKYACPVCDPKYDVDEILEECHLGSQKVRFVWRNDKKICRDGDLPSTVNRKCPFFTKEVQLAIIVAVIVVFIMAVISAYYWRKTQRLEYKYQKLVQSSSKDGTTQFAEAPSCGISEDEDEDDDEINGFGNDKKSILGKFKLKNGKAPFKDNQGSDDEAHVRLNSGGRYIDDFELENSASRI
ncbi:endosome/lysosome-associated apoptosis and autophagy regulator family member 2-like isoform X2 [Symsagittifera roscoffensis]|uniref:endosome/lysosome-associated apoptosis and autophagy regulator family member 2-like isoform X2 n=1 Tax=Symsagittifera roscoffensis TaxID=84072 RepID=UPI00307BB673